MVHIDIPPIVGYSLGEVSIQQANPKGFQRMFLVQIKLFWLKSSHIDRTCQTFRVFDPDVE
jgi:hypothetical protein